jgi:Ser-tRNA(Ala) deacylase AlaX
MTMKLFWEDPYLTVCKAKITSIEGNRVKVDRTIFYAFSGGQKSDQGTIAGHKVVSATKLGDKESIIDIEYELESEPRLEIGQEVEMRIDGNRRANLMRLHSVAHIAYFFLVEKFGKLKVIGSNIAADKARVDFLTDHNLSDLDDIEQRLNAFLKEGHVIKRYQDSSSPDLWWWECGSWKMPCGGTHVRNTAEIGNVLLKRKTKGSGKERIEIFLA